MDCGCCSPGDLRLLPRLGGAGQSRLATKLWVIHRVRPLAEQAVLQNQGRPRNSSPEMA